MIYISHRGNLEEKIKEEENNPEKILYCISKNFDVEIDVWLIENNFFLGHDEPQYKVNFEFLKNERLWCHAKNKEVLNAMLMEKKINCFWHQNDDYTITSNGYVWVYPNVGLLNNSIAVMPESTNYSIDELRKCHAICTDKPLYYKSILD